MRPYTDEELAAYSERSAIPRNMIYVVARDLDTGGPVEFGFWNGTGNVSLQVVDGLSGDTLSRSFTAKGAMLAVGDIPQADDLSVRSVTVTLSELNPDVENAFRGYDLRQAPIQIYRGLFSIDNPRVMVAPARCRFVGFVNQAPLTIPPVGGESSLALDCVSCTRELTRTNTDLRSDESQQRRTAGDRFFKWVPATGSVPIFWGQAKQ